MKRYRMPIVSRTEDVKECSVAPQEHKKGRWVENKVAEEALALYKTFYREVSEALRDPSTPYKEEVFQSQKAILKLEEALKVK